MHREEGRRGVEMVDEDKWKWEEREYVRQKVGGENRKGREEETEL